jgi:hypothetical protein
MLRARVEHTPRGAISAAGAGALLLSVAVLVACGESSQDKARAEVCAARNAISEQVKKLQGMALSSNAVDEAKSGLESIGDELRKIRDAQPDLAPVRKQEVEAATSRFGEELKAVGLQVASGLAAGTGEAALESARPKLKSALEALARDYRQALGPINC